ncbi:MAG: anhydro-N-acetylmuramic acid kinase [Nitrospirales bacterium]
MRVIGLMSGTSGDAVDAALVDIHGIGQALRVTPIAYHAQAYPPQLRHRLLDAATGGTVADVCHLNAAVGEVFAQAARQVVHRAGLKLPDVHLIGSHGQTLHHLPKPIREPGLGPVRSTLQIGAPAVIAERTGITTVADFRTRDMAAGGQGAPLAPYAHYVLLRHAKRSRLVVNLGGISNVTYLPAGGDLKSVLAFDTGPGNMLLDGLVSRLTRGKETMDRGGRLAGKGKVDLDLLSELMTHAFIAKAPPKSTGREEFGGILLTKLLRSKGRKTRKRRPPQDLLATCSLFTSMAVGSARRWITGPIEELVVAGGGVRNRSLMANLAAVFHPVPVRPLEDVGEGVRWDSQFLEAVAFAILAYQTVRGECANLPAATGATHPVVLGTIVPGGPAWRERLRS